MLFRQLNFLERFKWQQVTNRCPDCVLQQSSFLHWWRSYKGVHSGLQSLVHWGAIPLSPFHSLTVLLQCMRAQPGASKSLLFNCSHVRSPIQLLEPLAHSGRLRFILPQSSNSQAYIITKRIFLSVIYVKLISNVHFSDRLQWMFMFPFFITNIRILCQY